MAGKPLPFYPSKYNKIKNKASGAAIINLAFALCKFSNCPPYSTAVGSLISVSTIF
jgi:hypothetical protein